MASKLPRSQANLASVGCAGKSIHIDGWQIKGKTDNTSIRQVLGHQNSFTVPWYWFYKKPLGLYWTDERHPSPKQISAVLVIVVESAVLNVGQKISHRCSVGSRSGDCEGRRILLASFSYSSNHVVTPCARRESWHSPIPFTEIFRGNCNRKWQE